MKEYFKTLFRYENWANNDITRALLKADHIPPKALSLMSHIINAQVLWICRIKNEASPYAVWEEHSIEVISGILKKATELVADFINDLKDEDVSKNISYTNSRGDHFSSSIENILSHLIIHSSYHRGQIVLLIKPEVAVLPSTDYIHYVRTVSKS